MEIYHTQQSVPNPQKIEDILRLPLEFYEKQVSVAGEQTQILTLMKENRNFHLRQAAEILRIGAKLSRKHRKLLQEFGALQSC